jgi:tetratricopeptide (TPR) repeat protein
VESIARVLIQQRKPGEAEQLIDEILTPALVQNSNSVKLLNTRAKLKARRGQWQQAADDAALAFEYRPAEHNRYPVVAALLIKTQNREAYEKLRTRLLATRFETNNFFAADDVAKACLFLPCSETDLKTLGSLADRVMTFGAGNKGALPYFQTCKALYEYRQGHYAQAVEWGQKTLDSSTIASHGHASAVVAMAYWKLEKREEARAMLAKGELLSPREMPAHIAEDSGNTWLAWLYARIQLDEASALIQPASAVANHSTQP